MKQIAILIARCGPTGFLVGPGMFNLADRVWFHLGGTECAKDRAEAVAMVERMRKATGIRRLIGSELIGMTGEQGAGNGEQGIEP